jgi:hypothetical protein
VATEGSNVNDLTVYGLIHFRVSTRGGEGEGYADEFIIISLVNDYEVAINSLTFRFLRLSFRKGEATERALPRCCTYQLVRRLLEQGPVLGGLSAAP